MKITMNFTAIWEEDFCDFFATTEQSQIKVYGWFILDNCKGYNSPNWGVPTCFRTMFGVIGKVFVSRFTTFGVIGQMYWAQKYPFYNKESEFFEVGRIGFAVNVLLYHGKSSTNHLSVGDFFEFPFQINQPNVGKHTSHIDPFKKKQRATQEIPHIQQDQKLPSPK